MEKQKNEKKVRLPGKGKLHFNVIDIILIVLVLACIAGVIIRFTVLSRTGENSALGVYYITFSAQSVSYSATEAFDSTVADEERGWVFLSDGKTRVGEMTQASALPVSVVYIKDAEGKTVPAEYADAEKDMEYITYDVSGLIRCQGVISQTGGFLLNGDTPLVPGNRIAIQTLYGDFTVTVTSVDAAKGEE